MSMDHPVVWFEVVGRDAKKLQGFYAEMFGWQYKMSKNEYGLIQVGKGQVEGGIGAAPSGEGWSAFYVKVDDIERAVARAEKLGAKVIVPIERMPDVAVALL